MRLLLQKELIMVRTPTHLLRVLVPLLLFFAPLGLVLPLVVVDRRLRMMMLLLSFLRSFLLVVRRLVVWLVVVMWLILLR
jgi:hypothetical protein